MQLSPEIIAFLKKAGKVLLVENGNPELVILSIEEYQALTERPSARAEVSQPSPHHTTRAEVLPAAAQDIEEINREIAAISANEVFFLPPDANSSTPSSAGTYHAPFYRELE